MVPGYLYVALRKVHTLNVGLLIRVPVAGQGRHRGGPAEPFWEAQPEHQDYLERYPDGYTCHFIRPD
jgi:hypothetical protein